MDERRYQSTEAKAIYKIGLSNPHVHAALTMWEHDQCTWEQALVAMVNSLNVELVKGRMQVLPQGWEVRPVNAGVHTALLAEEDGVLPCGCCFGDMSRLCAEHMLQLQRDGEVFLGGSSGKTIDPLTVTDPKPRSPSGSNIALLIDAAGKSVLVVAFHEATITRRNGLLSVSGTMTLDPQTARDVFQRGHFTIVCPIRDAIGEEKMCAVPILFTSLDFQTGEAEWKNHGAMVTAPIHVSAEEALAMARSLPTTERLHEPMQLLEVTEYSRGYCESCGGDERGEDGKLKHRIGCKVAT